MVYISTTLQLLDQLFNFPTGFDVIVSCAEDWWEMYKAIKKMKII